MNEPVRPHLILMAGLPGSGKSSLALALGKRLGWSVIDKDVILSAMLEDVPNTVAQPATYAVMLAIGRDVVVNQHRSVILDSPATWEETVVAAKEICRDGNAILHVILCLADRDTRNDRVRTRTAQRSQPALGTSTTAGTGIKRFGHLPEDSLSITTDQDVRTCVMTIEAWLRKGTR